MAGPECRPTAAKRSGYRMASAAAAGSGGHAGQVDPVAVEAVLSHDGVDQRRDGRGFRLRRVAMPVPAAVRMRGLGLFGKQHGEPRALGETADARARGKRFGTLLAAVQHDDDRHAGCRRRCGGEIQRVGKMVHVAAGARAGGMKRAEPRAGRLVRRGAGRMHGAGASGGTHGGGWPGDRLDRSLGGRSRLARALRRARAGGDGEQFEGPQPEAGFPGHVQFRAVGRPWQEDAADSAVALTIERGAEQGSCCRPRAHRNRSAGRMQRNAGACVIAAIRVGHRRC